MTGGELDTAVVGPVVRAGSWPGLRWVLGLAALGGLLFTVGLVVRVRCAMRRCPAPEVRHLFDLDGLWSLPRLFTTGIFLGVAVLAVRAAVRSSGRPARWWAVVAGGGLLLCLAKAVSTHSAVERDDGRLATLVGGVLVTVLGLPLLWRAGHHWGVRGAAAVTGALAAYALAALGLDQVTAAVGAEWGSPVLRAVAVYVEEGGEAVTALVLLAVVARWMPGPLSRTGS